MNKKSSNTIMKKKLYLHIGFAKTGTSTIQTYLQTNLDSLRKLGYLLSNENMEFPTTGKINNIPLVYLDKLWQKNDYETLYFKLKHLKQKMDTTGINAAIISSENLSNYANLFLQINKNITNLNEMFDIKVIFYIRRQDEMILSTWKQYGCKLGLSNEEHVYFCLAYKFPNYLHILEKFEEIFGIESIIVKPFSRKYFLNQNLIDDFMNILQIDNSNFIEVASANESLDKSLVYFSYKNPWLFDNEHDNKPHDIMEKLLPKKSSIQKPDLSNAYRKVILNYFKENNKILQKKYLKNFNNVFSLDEKSLSSEETKTDEIDMLYRYLGFNFKMISELERRLSDLEQKTKQLEQKKIGFMKFINK